MGADSEHGKRLQEMAERCVFDCKNAYDGDSIAKRIVQALEEAFQAGVESVKAPPDYLAAAGFLCLKLSIDDENGQVLPSQLARILEFVFAELERKQEK